MPRDLSGNYTLPAGINPVVTGTLIDTAWCNPTMADFAVQFNNVITRDGLLGATAPLKLVDGLVGAPGLAWAAETNTGLYRVSAGLIGISVLGTQRVSIDNAGRVGIGVSGAAYPLDIRAAEPYVSIRKPAANSNFYGYNIMAGTDIISSWLLNATTGQVQFTAGYTGFGGLFTFNTDGTERMRIGATGAVSIGGDPVSLYSNGALAQLSVVEAGNWPTIGIKTFSNGAAANGGMLVLAASRGASGVNTATADGDTLGYITAEGVTSSSDTFWGAAIRFAQVGASSATRVPAQIQLATGPGGTGDVTTRMTVDINGNIISNVNASAPALAVNSQMVFSLTSNTNLRVSVRGTDGATRVANITLA